MYGADFPSSRYPVNSSGYEASGNPHDSQRQVADVHQVTNVYKRVEPDSARSSYRPPAYVSDKGREAIEKSEQELVDRKASANVFAQGRTNRAMTVGYLADVIEHDKKANKKTLTEALKFVEKTHGFGDSLRFNAKHDAQPRFFYGMDDERN